MKRVRPPVSAASSAIFDQAAPLSPFIIRKLASAKGLVVDSVMKGLGGRRIVRLADAKGSPIENPARSFGFTLYEAKRYLDQLPDRSPGKGAVPT